MTEEEEFLPFLGIIDVSRTSQYAWARRASLRSVPYSFSCGWAARNKYVALILVTGDLRLEAHFAQQSQPLTTREKPADMLVMDYTHRLVVFP